MHPLITAFDGGDHPRERAVQAKHLNIIYVRNDHIIDGLTEEQVQDAMVLVRLSSKIRILEGKTNGPPTCTPATTCGGFVWNLIGELVVLVDWK